MTFLNPFVLFGLIAAGIPILLHLLNLRKLKTIEFSTLTFLKELQRTKIRRLKIRQLLLLALRTLLIVFIVAAFSRPTLKGSLAAGLGEQAKTTAVVIFDDSQSMTANDTHGERLREAQDAALRVLDALKEGDEYCLLKLSEANSGDHELPASSRDFSLVRSMIKSVKPSFLHRTIEEALRYAARLTAASKNYNKELYVISDFQAGSVEAHSDPAQPENLFGSDVHFFLIPIAQRTLLNVGITSVSIPNALFEPEKPFTVRIGLESYSDKPIQDHLLSVFLNGERVTQKGIDLLPGKMVETEFSVIARKAGFIDGMVELEDDDLEFDNRRFFALYIPEQVRVLLLGRTSDLQYVLLALSALQSGGSTELRVQESSMDRFTAGQLARTDVVILANTADMSTGQVDRLRSFAEEGGGLILFPGPQLTPQMYNRLFVSALRIPTMAGVESVNKTETTSPVEFGKVDFRHPLFAGMFETEAMASGPGNKPAGQTRQRILESPAITTWVRYVLTPQSTTIISLSNGAPFLVEQKLGRGKILLAGVSATVDWSDFPLKGVFVPMLHRSVSYLAQEQSNQPSFVAGNEASVRIPPVSGRLSVVDPAHQEILLKPSEVSAGGIVRFGGTAVPGIYAVQSGSTTLQKFAVNTDPHESNTFPAEENVRGRVLKRVGINPSSVRIVQEPQEIGRLVLESRYGTELWKYCLVIALVLALAEMFVARDSTKEQASVLAQTG
ncbi:MAG: BatA domain-containing protein [Bacteroidota bacterium]